MDSGWLRNSMGGEVGYTGSLLLVLPPRCPAWTMILFKHEGREEFALFGEGIQGFNRLHC